MKNNETLYTLTVYYHVEKTSSFLMHVDTYHYQFVGLKGLHMAMECAKDCEKVLTNKYEKYHLYKMVVDKTIVLG